MNRVSLGIVLVLLSLFATRSALAQSYTLAISATPASSASNTIAVERLVTYTISASQSGTNGPANPDIALNPTASLSFISAASPWVCSNLVCSISGNFGPTPLQVVFRMPASVPGFNPADASSPYFSSAQLIATPLVSGSPAGSSASVSSVFGFASDYQTVVSMPATAVAGSAVPISFSITNAGPYLSFLQARLVVDLPSNLRYTGRAAGGASAWSCPPASGSPGGSLTCTRSDASVDPASSPLTESFTLNTVAVQPGTGNVASRIEQGSRDLNNANDERQTPITVSPPPEADVAIAMTGPASGSPNATLSYRAELRNLSASVDAQSLAVVFDQPGADKLSIGSASGAGWSCQVSADRFSASCNRANLGAGALSAIDVSGSAPPVSAGLTANLNLRASVTASNDSQLSNNTASVATQVAGPPRVGVLVVEKRSDVAVVSPGSEFEYTLTARNSDSAGTLSGVRLRDDVPLVFSILGTDLGSSGFSCSVVGNSVDCALSQLAPNTHADVKLRVRVSGNSLGAIQNTALLSANEAPSAITASATVTIVAASAVDLALVKTDSADPVAIGTSFSYVLEVTNRGSRAASNVQLSDSLPAGIRATAIDAPGWTCSGLTTAQISCLRPSLAVAETSVVRITVNATAAGSVRNTAQVSSQEADANAGNNSDDEITLITNPASAPADLEVVSITSAPLGVGQSSEVIANLRNLGPGSASVVRASATVEGFTLVAASSPAGSCSVSGANAACLLGDLAPNALVQITLLVRPNVVGAGAVSVALSSASSDPNSTNNSRRESFSAADALGSDLSLVLRDSVDTVDLNGQFDYLLTVNNAGPDIADGISVLSTLPDGVEFVSASGAAWSCTPAARIVRCTLAGPLAVGASSVLTIRARATQEVGRLEFVGVVSATGRDPSLANNTARETTLINARDPEALQTIITQEITDRFARDAAPVIANICANPAADLLEQCRAIVNAALDRDVPGLEAGLRALYPEEVLSQRLALNQQAATQFTNVDARLNELRSGGGGFSVSGLNVQWGGTSIPLGLLQQLAQDEVEVGESGDLVSPWGFFLNGTISRGDQSIDRSTRNVSADFDNINITAGVDYRASARLVFGGALGFSKFDSELSDFGRSSNRALTLTGYGSYYFNDNLYVDSRLTFGNASFDLTRRIRFTIRDFSVDRTATSDSDARQFAFASGVGYHLNKAGWTFTPNLGLRFFRSDVDSFTETGAGANNIAYGEQTVDSLQYSLGMQVSRAFSLSHGVLAPQFDLSFSRETKNDEFELNARLLGATPNQSFRVVTDEPDQSFGNVGIGFVYVTANGKQAYISYRKLLANDAISRDSINLGGRFEF